MKKKIEDLTIKEILKYCKLHIKNNCKKCQMPFLSTSICDLKVDKHNHKLSKKIEIEVELC